MSKFSEKDDSQLLASLLKHAPYRFSNRTEAFREALRLISYDLTQSSASVEWSPIKVRKRVDYIVDMSRKGGKNRDVWDRILAVVSQQRKTAGQAGIGNTENSAKREIQMRIETEERMGATVDPVVTSPSGGVISLAANEPIEGYTYSWRAPENPAICLLYTVTTDIEGDRTLVEEYSNDKPHQPKLSQSLARVPQDDTEPGQITEKDKTLLGMMQSVLQQNQVRSEATAEMNRASIEQNKLVLVLISRMMDGYEKDKRRRENVGYTAYG
ncbi:hypothetical protein BABINDRAFT_162452 [Babjeviella inositovora NRRL Y-12698]|uniref:Uncharacterized protein n=1 Tax=Babjeviella inositovora NRRL Y-12698 TaxID=984486 RepID=A0A1E3QM42_9ASCO|nr:uncharacterized protein BABINDRAFT_162452 [Babjeviella inositovora NRRL Y-12698]ODQ78766.1 hypothetical protein BABINDRAFT_162452 [Babjeviella inositovora NRRL Y-12698]